MTSVLVEWLLRPETLAWISAAALVLRASRPVAEYVEREIPLEGEIR